MKVFPLLAIGIGSVVGLGGPLLLKGDSGQPSAAPVSAPSECVTANGVVEGARPEVALRAEVAGALAAVHARENQDVKQGAVLAESQKQQVALAKAELAVAKADLDKLRNGERAEKRKAAAAAEAAKQAIFQQADADWKRSQRLGRTGSASAEQSDGDYFRMVRARSEYESATAERALAEAPPRPDELAAAEARVAAEAKARLAEAELAKTRITAPTPGRVLQVFAEPGETAGPASAQPVFLLADLSKRRVRAFVEELDVARVHAGQRAAVTADGFPGREFTGTVAVVVPRMGKRSPLSDAPGEYKDVYYREVLIDLDAGDELPTNLRVQVRVRTEP